jgi:N-acyl homoserine lactone hydrolase
MTSSPRLFVLDSGLIACSDYSLYSPAAAPGQRQDMSVRSYLLTHPDGALLWDTGLDDAIAAEPGGRRIDEDHRFHVRRTLRSQLGEVGVTPGDIGVVGMSHLHVDHVGNLQLFEHATVVLQAAEQQAASSARAEDMGYFPPTYAALEAMRVRTVSGVHDVFGDGVAVTVPLPGHTPGHQGLLVTLPETGPVLLAGDVAYTAADYAAGRVRTGDVDPAGSAASIERAKRLERERGATVWLHHDLEAQRAVRLAPDGYR